MSTQNGQNSIWMKSSNSNSAGNTRKVLKKLKLLSKSQYELIDFINFCEPLELSKDFQMVHDIALYLSDAEINDPEKKALYHLKMISEILQEIAE